jgi:alkylation response protein AidB-like acyl-CoA dehydrogenase
MANQKVLVDHVGMNSSPSVMAKQATHPEADPEALFAQVVALGMTRLAVPRELGGLGGVVAMPGH